MKTLINWHRIPTEVYNYLKLINAIVWLIYLHIAYYHQVFFEAFFLSIVVMMIAGFVSHQQYNHRKSQNANQSKKLMGDKTGNSSEDYLNVFFYSPG